MSAYQVSENCLYNVLTLIAKSGGYGEHYQKAQPVIKKASSGVLKAFRFF